MPRAPEFPEKKRQVSYLVKCGVQVGYEGRIGNYHTEILHRGEKSIMEAVEMLHDIIWLNEHLALAREVGSGRETVDPKFWEESLLKEQRIREEYKGEILLASDVYDWGMLNGQLSALQ